MEDEKGNEKFWDEYYNNLDPDGKKFWNAIQQMTDLQHTLFHYLLERGQLYGAILFIMEKYNIDSFQMTRDELTGMKKAMLYFENPEDDKTTLIVRRGYPWGQ